MRITLVFIMSLLLSGCLPDIDFTDFFSESETQIPGSVNVQLNYDILKFNAFNILDYANGPDVDSAGYDLSGNQFLTIVNESDDLAYSLFYGFDNPEPYEGPILRNLDPQVIRDGGSILISYLATPERFPEDNRWVWAFYTDGQTNGWVVKYHPDSDEFVPDFQFNSKLVSINVPEPYLDYVNQSGLFVVSAGHTEMSANSTISNLVRSLDIEELEIIEIDE